MRVYVDTETLNVRVGEFNNFETYYRRDDTRSPRRPRACASESACALDPCADPVELDISRGAAAWVSANRRGLSRFRDVVLLIIDQKSLTRPTIDPSFFFFVTLNTVLT